MDTAPLSHQGFSMDRWHRELLESSRSGVLATIAEDGRSQLVPVCYALIESQFVIPIDEKPKEGGTLARVSNIGRDPRVSLLVHHYDDRWERLAWVRVEGEATMIAVGQDWPAALAALRGSYPQYQMMALEELPLIRIEPKRVVAWRWPEGENPPA